MSENEIKIYTELMKALTAFILGTGAGVFSLISSPNSNHFFLIFVGVLCAFAVGSFVLLLFTLRKISNDN